MVPCVFARLLIQELPEQLRFAFPFRPACGFSMKPRAFPFRHNVNALALGKFCRQPSVRLLPALSQPAPGGRCSSAAQRRLTPEQSVPEPSITAEAYFQASQNDGNEEAPMKPKRPSEKLLCTEAAKPRLLIVRVHHVECRANGPAPGVINSGSASVPGERRQKGRDRIPRRMADARQNAYSPKRRPV